MSRIILFGQSAGPEDIDFNSYAWTSGPIITGLVLQSGTTGHMEAAWVVFAQDQENGLDGFGWPRWDPERPTLIRLGYGNGTGPNKASPSLYDLCD